MVTVMAIGKVFTHGTAAAMHYYDYDTHLHCRA
jgi:hypothetical protein